MSENEKNILEQLNSDVVIPQKVRVKADMAFESIRKEAELTKNSQTERIPRQENKKTTVGGRKKMTSKRIWILSAAAILAAGCVSVGAAIYMNWSKSLSEGLRATEEQKKTLEDSGMVNMVGQTVTDQGISVTLEQTMVDNYFAYLVFKVNGYTVPDRTQPDFEHFQVLVDGKDGWDNGEDEFGISAAFYSGVVTGPDLKPQKADGSPLDTDENGDLIYEYYTQEDGSMEFWIILDGHGNKGGFLNKPVHVELENLGTVDKAAYIPGLEGKWAFDCILNGSEDMRVIDLEAPIGDTSMTVTHVELSPISAYIEYRVPDSQEKEKLQDTYPGLKLKDGTCYPYIWDEPGIKGKLSSDSDTYVTNFSFDRIIDVDQVEGLMFLKKNSDGPIENMTDDDYYLASLDGDSEE